MALPAPRPASSTRAMHPSPRSPEVVQTNHRCCPPSFTYSHLHEVVHLTDTFPLAACNTQATSLGRWYSRVTTGLVKIYQTLGDWDRHIYTIDTMYKLTMRTLLYSFAGGSDDKEFACNSGGPVSIPGSRRSLVEGNGNPLQYSCLENSMDRGAWRATVHRITKSRTRLTN